MSCTCSENLEPWQRPLLTQRKGLRRDAQSARLAGSFINGRLVERAEASAHLAEDDLINRSDAAETAWPWGDASASGGGGNTQVGPGWGSSSSEFRTDAAGIELIIDGRRCVEVDNAWRDADGAPCFTDDEED